MASVCMSTAAAVGRCSGLVQGSDPRADSRTMNVINTHLYRGGLWLFCALFASSCGANSCGSSDVGASMHLPWPDSDGDVVFVAPNGDDGGTGGAEDPLRTIASALDRLQPGDVLHLQDGDYRDQGLVLAAMLVGTDAAPIRLQGSREAIISGIVLNGSRWVELRGFTIAGPKVLPEGWLDMPAVNRAGIHLPIDRRLDWNAVRRQQVLEEFPGYAHFIDYSDNPDTWQNDFSAGVLVNASSHIIVQRLAIRLHTACVQIQNDSSQVLLQDNLLSHCLDGVRGHSGLSHQTSMRQITIRGNDVQQSFREGIAVSHGARGVLVEDNRVGYSGHSHLVTFNAPRARYPCAGHVRFHHNHVERGGYYTETMQFPGSSGISLHSCGSGCQADANRIAFQFDLTGADGNGLIVDRNGEDGGLLLNNLVYRVQGSGIALVESAAVQILHNTLVQSGRDEFGGATPWPANGMAIRLFGADSAAATILNNVAFDHANGGLFFDGAPPLQQAQVDFNLYHAPGVPVSGVLDLSALVVYQTLAEHRAALGLDSNGLDDEPLLLKVVERDFRPAHHSPVRRRGLGGLGIIKDADDSARDPAHPSVGALEPPERVFVDGFESP